MTRGGELFSTLAAPEPAETSFAPTRISHGVSAPVPQIRGKRDRPR
jgi:hypothetical protein